MKKMNQVDVTVNKFKKENILVSVYRDQKGFNVLGFLAFVAVVVVLALLVIPNINMFLGVDKKLNAANLEAFNMRVAAIAYEINVGKGVYPADSDVLWTADYVGQPRAYYTFNGGNGRIMDATMDTVGHVPANPWTGIKWDNTSDSWVKQ